MMYLLDTNVWIQLLNSNHPKVIERFHQTDPNKIRLCTIVKAELYFGAYHSTKVQSNLTLLHYLFTQYDSLNFDDDAAKAYGQIRSHLFKIGKPIGPNDMMIAAIAFSNQATLVSHNTKEFGRINGLSLVDWEE